MAHPDDWDAPPDVAEQTLSYFARGMRTFWRLVAPERNRILAAMGVLAAVETTALGIPLFFKTLVDYLPVIYAEGITAYALTLVVMMFVVRLITLVLRRFVQEPLFLRAIIRLENLWPTAALTKLLGLSVGFHERENTGRKIAKVSKGVEKLVAILVDLFWGLAPALIYLAANIIILFALDWKLALLFALPLIPAVWINLKSYGVFYPVWEEWERRKEESIGLFCQSVINIRTVQSFVSEEREDAQHGSIREHMRIIDLDIALRMQRYYFVMELILGLSFVFTIVIGLYFAYRGWSTLGTVAFLFITGNAALQSLWSMVQVYTRMMRNLVAAERMQELLLEEPDVRNEAPGTTLAMSRGRLAFENVSLIYAGKDHPVIRNFSLKIEPGEMLAFVGKSGSGKSTLVSLLTRVYDPSEGAVTLESLDIRTLDRNWYRRRFAYVPQDIEIFDGTIRENIAYASPEADEDLLTRAIEAACLGEVLSDAERFPDGLDTQVGERGVRLSGGEKQRVGIARAYVALLSGADVLVLDEATSSLDSQSERVVQTFVEKLRDERDITIVAIAHRLSTIQRADRICVLDAGRIVEIGDHARLLEKNGLYKLLVTLQQLGELRE